MVRATWIEAAAKTARWRERGRDESAPDRELRWSCVAGSGRERVGEGIRLEWNRHAKT